MRAGPEPRESFGGFGVVYGGKSSLGGAKFSALRSDGIDPMLVISEQFVLSRVLFSVLR